MIEADAITFETFRKIVGEKKIEMFNNFNENDLHGEDFLTLFNLYKEFFKTNRHADTLHENFESGSNVESFNLNDQNVETIAMEPADCVGNEQEFDIENIPIIMEPDYDCQIPSTSSANIEEDTLNSSPHSHFVIWPKTPERKGKRETEKLPFVLTSTVRKEAIKKKIAIKKEIEAEKETRKTERLNKKKIKEQALNKKEKRISRKNKSSLKNRKVEIIENDTEENNNTIAQLHPGECVGGVKKDQYDTKERSKKVKHNQDDIFGNVDRQESIEG